MAHAIDSERHLQRQGLARQCAGTEGRLHWVEMVGIVGHVIEAAEPIADIIAAGENGEHARGSRRSRTIDRDDARMRVLRPHEHRIAWFGRLRSSMKRPLPVRSR